ncbi:Signal transduction histidine kinase [Octadecabacter temperatus]|uniref:histidine kinase n=1 Tax=Octadecabacter temperatus TaxID=1458307 RepID=A0A0K0Y2K7_9RHOB|nr:ATP-binding protein [Octadecabacter temperatus]AKS45136.1 Osmolarity sensor protein EnvZ [Octadecabacter temperatus]SIN86871.1 Signal transduction histidine kinase [Octadecabacter temperatus]
MKRLGPFFSKLGTQLIVLLGVSILISFVVAMIATTLFQRANDQSSRDQSAASRVVELFQALDGLSETERSAVSKAASNRTTTISVSQTPSVIETADSERSRALVARVREDVRIQSVTGSILSRALPNASIDDRNSARSREVIAISAELSDGTWLNFRSRAPQRWYTNSDLKFITSIFFLTVASVSIVSGLFVGRIIAPVKALSAAARSSMSGPGSTKVKESGPSELRDAARAFNSMQDEIERFDSERKRTVAALGHDLRTPLTSLRISVEDIGEDDLRDRMIRNLEELTRMADGLVNFAHVGVEEDLTDKVELSALIATICADANIPFKSCGETYVVGGQVSLARALRNITDNAIKYGENARAELRSSKGIAHITVSDEGQGLGTVDLESLFQPFVRGDSSRNLETGGAGLGLSTSRRVVQAHDGSIHLARNEAGGLTVEIRFPLPFLS